jgi:hypothetical protein
MATLKTIAEIIQIAKISITISANKVGEDIGIFGKSPDRKIPLRIFNELISVQYLYDNFPSEDFTRSSANYLYDLCFPYNKQAEAIVENLSGLPPTVSGPSNASVADGETASFTVTVTSTTAYTVQWYRGITPITGATSNTYSFTADDTDDGAQFHAVVTNLAGSTISQTGTLTVTTQSVGHYYVGDTDYYSALNGGTDSITYNGTFNIVDGDPLSVTISDPSSTLGNNKYHVYKYPKAQGLKTTWYSEALNQGAINDQVFRQIIEIGNYYYIVSRVAISVNTSVPMIFT